MTKHLINVYGGIIQSNLVCWTGHIFLTKVESLKFLLLAFYCTENLHCQHISDNRFFFFMAYDIEAKSMSHCLTLTCLIFPCEMHNICSTRWWFNMNYPWENNFTIGAIDYLHLNSIFFFLACLFRSFISFDPLFKFSD